MRTAKCINIYVLIKRKKSTFFQAEIAKKLRIYSNLKIFNMMPQFAKYISSET